MARFPSCGGEEQYLNNLDDVLVNGKSKGDRTGTGTISLFRPNTMRFKIENGLNFPLLTTKKVNYKAVLNELLWFISGSTNVNDLDSNIWNEWADPNTGSIGPMYGESFRSIPIDGMFNNCEQVYMDPLGELISDIKRYPDSRRLVMTTWRPDKLPAYGISPIANVKLGRQALAPCHGVYQQYYVSDGKLSLAVMSRSQDMMLGVPFNIASYATLLLIVANLTGLYADELIYDMGDAHIYNNHIDGAKVQLSRQILNPFPSLVINGNQETIDDFKFEDFEIQDYFPQSRIKLKVSV